MHLPPDVWEAVEPVFDLLAPDESMACLVVEAPADGELVAAVARAVGSPALGKQPALCAGLWLYADDLRRSHSISQGIDNSTGAFWHGIMHRREGDFSNSHYWFRRAGRHSAMDAVAEYDPHAFIDDVEARFRQKPEELVRQQQDEWRALFEWCANRYKLL